MQIQINAQSIEYISDFNEGKGEGWERQNDPFAFFKFPVILGDEKLFVKRFERSPRAYDFLESIKEKKTSYIPRVFDLQSTKEVVNEKQQNIIYLFEEFIPGKKLREAIIGNGLDINFYKLTNDLWKSLNELHKHGVWHTDFCEENIIVSEDNQFYLIDFDSGDFINKPIDTNYVIFKEYNALVFGALKELDEDFTFQDIAGDNLNMLELLIMLSYYKSVALGEVNYNTLGDQKTIDQIKANIPSFDDLLMYARQNKLSFSIFEDIILRWFPNDSKFYFLSNDHSYFFNHQEAEPEIDHTNTNYDIINGLVVPTIEFTLDGNNVNSFEGKYKSKVRLSWFIQNASEIEVGVIGKEDNIYSKVYSIKEQGEKDFEIRRSETLVIEAINKSPDSIKKQITKKEIEIIAVIPPLLTPEILSFEVNGSRKTKHYVNLGETITFTWKVKNASHIFIDDLELNLVNETSMTYKVEQSMDFFLIAISKRDEEERINKSNVITVKLRKEELVIPQKIYNTYDESININQTLDSLLEDHIPSIEYILINDEDLRTANIKKGEQIIISWNFKNTDCILINNEEYDAKGEISLTVDEDLEIYFEAQDIFETLSINAILEEPIARAQIEDFSINSTLQSELVLREDQPALLTWSVSDAKSIFLYKDDQEIQLPKLSSGKIDIGHFLKGDKNKEVNLILKAINEEGEISLSSKKLKIQPKPTLSPIKILLIILGIIISFILLGILIV